MIARTETLDRTVGDTAVKCLMLLSRLGECNGGGGGEGGEKRVFRCKTCLKEFSSFQALGGHRASHKKPAAISNNSTGDEQSSSSSLSSSGSVAKKRTASQHLCPICGMEFPIGQALGGHMRKHRNVKESGGVALVTRSLLPVETTATTTTVTTLKKSSSGKRVACLDWGLDSNESLINLKLELGRTIY